MLPAPSGVHGEISRDRKTEVGRGKWNDTAYKSINSKSNSPENFLLDCFEAMLLRMRPSPLSSSLSFSFFRGFSSGFFVSSLPIVGKLSA